MAVGSYNKHLVTSDASGIWTYSIVRPRLKSDITCEVLVFRFYVHHITVTIVITNENHHPFP